MPRADGHPYMLTEYACKEVVKKLNAARANVSPAVDIPGALPELRMDGDSFASSLKQGSVNQEFLDWFRVHKSGIKQFRKLQKPIVTRSTRRYAAFKAKVVEWIASCNDRDDAVQFLQTVLDSPAVSALLRRRVVRDTEAAETLVTVGEQA